MHNDSNDRPGHLCLGHPRWSHEGKEGACLTLGPGGGALNNIGDMVFRF